MNLFRKEQIIRTRFIGIAILNNKAKLSTLFRLINSGIGFLCLRSIYQTFPISILNTRLENLRGTRIYLFRMYARNRNTGRLVHYTLRPSDTTNISHQFLNRFWHTNRTTPCNLEHRIIVILSPRAISLRWHISVISLIRDQPCWWWNSGICLSYTFLLIHFCQTNSQTQTQGIGKTFPLRYIILINQVDTRIRKNRLRTIVKAIYGSIKFPEVLVIDILQRFIRRIRLYNLISRERHRAKFIGSQRMHIYTPYPGESNRIRISILILFRQTTDHYINRGDLFQIFFPNEIIPFIVLNIVLGTPSTTIDSHLGIKINL